MIASPEEASFHARYNSNLNEMLSVYYDRLDKTAAMIVAIASSGSAVGYYAKLFGDYWKFALVLAAIISVIRPILAWSKLHASHHGLGLSYHCLELRMNNMPIEEIRSEFSRLAAMEPETRPVFFWDFITRKAEEKTKKQLNYL